MKVRALLIEALVGIASAAVAAGSFCWMVKYTVLKEADMIVIAAFLWLWVACKLLTWAKYIISRIETRDKCDKRDKTITKRDLLRLCRQFSTVEEMEPGLQVLVEHGYIAIKKEKPARGGRVSEQIYINPAYYQWKEEQRK